MMALDNGKFIINDLHCNLYAVLQCYHENMKIPKYSSHKEVFLQDGGKTAKTRSRSIVVIMHKNHNYFLF